MDTYARAVEFFKRHPRIKPVASLARRATRNVYEPLGEIRGARKIRGSYPKLADKRRLMTSFPTELVEWYEEYVRGVSDRVMSISLELSSFTYALCVEIRPSAVIDLGSGFSSAVLRHYEKVCNPNVEVWSVDSSDEWLNATREFLVVHDVSAENLVTWKQFKTSVNKEFDIVLYDLGHVRGLRMEALKDALGLVRPGGMMILDDMNFIAYKKYVKRVLKGYDFELYPLGALTNDCLGRYSYLLHRPFADVCSEAR